MKFKEPLELSLKHAYTDGSAFFTDNSGNNYFRPLDGGNIRPLIEGHDNNPSKYNDSNINILAEVGRKFPSTEEANHYVSAITDFERMLKVVRLANTSAVELTKSRAYSQVIRLQERIIDEDLDVLETIPNFKRFRKYLFTKPEDIYVDLKRKIKNTRNSKTHSSRDLTDIIER